MELKTDNALPELPMKFTTSDSYISLISNKEYKVIDGNNWKVHLLECFDGKKKEYNLELLNSKLTLLNQLSMRPPKKTGGRTDLSHYNDKMINAKKKIDSILDETGIQQGKDGKYYGGHFNNREYIKHPRTGKFVLKTTYKPKTDK